METHGLRVGLVLSNPANQIVSLVVEEDIAFGPENMGLSSQEIHERIKRALGAIHGEYLRQELTSAISGGELAKVAFAGQLALDADVLVLDEGTVMLDPTSRASLLETVKELNRTYGKTIIHISHRLDDLECAEAVLDLINTIKDNALPGIEPGEKLIYQGLLIDLGIHEQDMKIATRMLAQEILARQ